MKIKEDKIINGVLIPKGTEVQFSTEGFCIYKGQAFHKSEVALEYEEHEFEESISAEPSPSPDILFKIDNSQFWLKHGDYIRMFNLKVVKQPDEGPAFDDKTIGFAWPSDSKQARAIIQLIVESGYAGDDILERWPDLMNAAGYVDAGELNELWKRNVNYAAANGYRGGIQAIEAKFSKRKNAIGATEAAKIDLTKMPADSYEVKIGQDCKLVKLLKQGVPGKACKVEAEKLGDPYARNIGACKGNAKYDLYAAEITTDMEAGEWGTYIVALSQKQVADIAKGAKDKEKRGKQLSGAFKDLTPEAIDDILFNLGEAANQQRLGRAWQQALKRALYGD